MVNVPCRTGLNPFLFSHHIIYLQLSHLLETFDLTVVERDLYNPLNMEEPDVVTQEKNDLKSIKPQTIER